MLIGTIFLGKVNKMNGQRIETKFFMLGVPLFPVSSMWVTSSGFRTRQGISIPLNTKSIIAGYARIYSLIIAIPCLWVALNNLALIIFGLLWAAVWAYFFFIYGQTAKDEQPEQQKFGSITGLYILPHWIDYTHLYSMYERAEQRYQAAFRTDWMEDLLNDNIEDQKLPLLQFLACLNQGMAATAENKSLFEKAEGLLQSRKERAAAVLN